jgi:nicotinamide-nucleotide amidase
MLAEIITIGDELLIGQVIDTNSAWIAQEFNQAGIAIHQITSVSDEGNHIKKAVKDAMIENDIVLLTGGLGPTKDDITKQALCELFNTRLIFDSIAYENVERIFSGRGLEMLDSNKAQAMLPEICTALYNSCGTAPGMWFSINVKIIVSMPGVPYEMKAMMSRDVMPRLKGIFQFPSLIHNTLQTAGVGESFIAEKIKPIEDALPAYIKLAYLPSLGVVRLRLTGKGENKIELNEEINKYKNQIKETLGEIIFAEGEITLQEHLCNLLKQKSCTIALAESCTGGYVSSLIVQIPGCSAYFMGSTVTYSYDAKENILGVNPETLNKFGAVSKECVEEMLYGCKKKYETNCAIAISGIAGPDGGTAEKPVGTIFIGVIVNENIFIKRFIFENNRQRNIERAAMAALNLMRLQLERYVV